MPSRLATLFIGFYNMILIYMAIASDLYTLPISYYITWVYVKLRWIIYSLTGHFGFENENVTNALRAALREQAAEQPAVRTVPVNFRREHPRRKLTKRVHLNFFDAKAYLVLPRTTTLRLRYLGKFTYESWNDKRWRPREEDYEADDEAEEAPRWE